MKPKVGMNSSQAKTHPWNSIRSGWRRRGYTLAGVALFIGASLVAVAITIRVASPGRWNWFWDKDARTIRPPQYLMQVPSSIVRLGNQYVFYWNDRKDSKDFSSHWRMVESPDDPVTGIGITGFGAPGPQNAQIRIPVKNKSGPFWTCRDLRKQMIDQGVKEVTLYGGGVVVKAR